MLTQFSRHLLGDRWTLLPGETYTVKTPIWEEAELEPELRTLSDLKFHALSHKQGKIYVSKLLFEMVGIVSLTKGRFLLGKK